MGVETDPATSRRRDKVRNMIEGDEGGVLWEYGSVFGQAAAGRRKGPSQDPGPSGGLKGD